MGQTLSEPVTTKDSASCANENYLVGSSCMQGWRINMEDAHTHLLSLPDDPKCAFFAVYDGHAGPKVSQYAGINLHKRIVLQNEYGEGDMKRAIEKGFLALDDQMRIDEEMRDDVSGTTAVVVIVKENTIFCGNVGDSRAIASVVGEARPLSYDHKPAHPTEARRIIAAGGWVEFNRVNGNLALSRALGDFVFKRNENKSAEEQIVTAFPDVITDKLTPDHEFIVLACDGIWDVMSNQEVVDFVRERLADKRDPQTICEELLTRCLAPDCQMGGLGCDNMTVVIVGLLHGESSEVLFNKCARPAVISDTKNDEESSYDQLPIDSLRIDGVTGVVDEKGKHVEKAEKEDGSDEEAAPTEFRVCARKECTLNGRGFPIVSRCLAARLIISMRNRDTILALLLTFSLQLIQITLCDNATSPCIEQKHFDCGVGLQRCIPLEWMCDNVADCDNGSDEMKCSYIHSCPSNYMMCRSGECVAKIYKCDKEQDCQDGSDEVHCDQVIQGSQRPNDVPVFPPTRTTFSTFFSEKKCDGSRMLCRSGQCISSDLVCDGNKDCAGGDDEDDCLGPTSLCKDGYIACKSGDACIPESWVCDGSEDCKDGSDELQCVDEEQERFSHGQTTVINQCSIEGQFHCQTVNFESETVCIPMNATCNGEKDCPMGDDESPLCAECSRKHCEQTCENTPSGAKCVCQRGWKLDVDGVGCVDEDECLTHGHLCQQYCEDSRGTYNCKCAPGYVLGNDGHSCRLDRSQEGLLFLSLGSEIRHMPLADASTSNEGYTTVQKVGGHGIARSVDFLNRNKKIFMAISSVNGQEGELAVSDRGLLRVLRENVSGIGYIAVDWMGGNVFFTRKSPSTSVGITVCSMNGFFCKWIIRGQESQSGDAARKQNYRGLAVHPLRGTIVYIDTYKSKSKIMMADMDGSNIRSLVDNKLEFPSGLSIDLLRNDVYFGDVERKMIERVNMDTRDRRVVLSTGVSHPYDLIFFNGFLYWTDWGTENLKVAELSEHHSSPRVIHSFNRFPYGLAINHSMYQPVPSANPCESLECAWLCVPFRDVEGLLRGRCVCPDGYNTTKEDCVPHETGNTTEASYIGTALMKEYCLNGVGCFNGGSCNDVVNEHGRTERIVCECVAPYEGLHCERLNPEKLLAIEETSVSAFLVLVIFFMVFLIMLAALVLFYQQNEDFKQQADRALSSAQGTVNELAVRTNIMAEPLVNKLRDTIARRSERPNHVVSSSTLAANALVDPEPGRPDITSPTSYHNPLYSEVPTEASPIAGHNDAPFRDRPHREPRSVRIFDSSCRKLARLQSTLDVTEIDDEDILKIGEVREMSNGILGEKYQPPAGCHFKTCNIGNDTFNDWLKATTDVVLVDDKMLELHENLRTAKSTSDVLLFSEQLGVILVTAKSASFAPNTVYRGSVFARYRDHEQGRASMKVENALKRLGCLWSTHCPMEPLPDVSPAILKGKWEQFCADGLPFWVSRECKKEDDSLEVPDDSVEEGCRQPTEEDILEQRTRNSLGIALSTSCDEFPILEQPKVVHKEYANLSIPKYFHKFCSRKMESCRKDYRKGARRAEEPCALCTCNVSVKITYKDVLILEQFMRDDGTVLPRQLTGLCKKQQLRVERCVMQAHWLQEIQQILER
ncbi:unnamed protein product [Caenorhabditis auriculariae]|uniref:protein-serine/threonine phosphatase n=1 Tax=Caenorhabditis auriculariae TaxID=2777116 RepID=A0A8S1GY49_9PELO|nr:unnamed protein product [Caenorhabditis auriculariae]